MDARMKWIALATFTMAAACGGDRDTGAVSSTTAGGTSSAPAAEAVEERDNALVRVVHAIPRGGAVNIFAGDSAAFEGVEYRTVTPFKEMPDDYFGFRIVKGSDPEAELATNREKLDDGGHYTIVALPDEGGAGKANLRVLNDDLKPVTDGKARVRVIHAITNGPEVDLFVRGQDDAIFDGINFRKEAGWKEIDPVTGTLELRPQGKRNTLARVPNVAMQAGRTYTYVVAGTPAKVDVIAIEDNVAELGD